jgi:hypothetical protein
MSETISLEWIGAQLRTIQAEQRTIRTENELLRSALAEVVRVLSERIGNFEALTEARVDQLTNRVAGLEATMEARFDQMGRALAEHTARVIVAIEGLAKP